MATLVLRTLDFNNATKIINLPDGVSPQDAATIAQLNAAISGLNWKDSARIAASTNITIASPGASLDGIAMTSGDRVLLRGQTLPEANGLYIWNGAAVPMTRSIDMDAAAEVEAAVVSIEEGTSAGQTFRQSAVNVTLGTTPLTFSAFGTSAGAASETSAGIAEIATLAEVNTGTDDLRFVTPLKLATSDYASRKFAANVGDGSATAITLTHSLNTFDVTVEVYRNSGNRDTVIVEATRPTVNTVTLTFDVAPTSNQFRALIRA